MPLEHSTANLTSNWHGPLQHGSGEGTLRHRRGAINWPHHGLGRFANAASTKCDYGGIAPINQRPMTDREREICANTALGIMLQTALLIGAMASSISTQAP